MAILQLFFTRPIIIPISKQFTGRVFKAMNYIYAATKKKKSMTVKIKQISPIKNVFSRKTQVNQLAFSSQGDRVCSFTIKANFQESYKNSLSF